MNLIVSIRYPIASLDFLVTRKNSSKEAFKCVYFNHKSLITMKKLVTVLFIVFLSIIALNSSYAQIRLGRSLQGDSSSTWMLYNMAPGWSYNQWFLPRYLSPLTAGRGLSLNSSTNALQLNVKGNLSIVDDTLIYGGITWLPADDSTIYKDLYGNYRVRLQSTYGIFKNSGGMGVKLSTTSGLTFNSLDGYSLEINPDSGVIIANNKIKIKTADDLGFDASGKLDIKSIDLSKVNVADLGNGLNIIDGKLTADIDTNSVYMTTVGTNPKAIAVRTRVFLFWSDSAGVVSNARYLTRSPGPIIDTVGYAFSRGGYILNFSIITGDGFFDDEDFSGVPIRFEAQERISIYYKGSAAGAFNIRVNSVDKTEFPLSTVPPINNIYLEVILDNP